MFESAETATTCRISTPHGIIGCDAVMEVAAAAASAAEAPVSTESDSMSSGLMLDMPSLSPMPAPS